MTRPPSPTTHSKSSPPGLEDLGTVPAREPPDSAVWAGIACFGMGWPLCGAHSLRPQPGGQNREAELKGVKTFEPLKSRIRVGPRMVTVGWT